MIEKVKPEETSNNNSSTRIFCEKNPFAVDDNVSVDVLSNENYPSRSPLLSDGKKYLYLVSQCCENKENENEKSFKISYFVDIYNPKNNFNHIKRIKVQDHENKPFFTYSDLQRGSLYTDGNFLVNSVATSSESSSTSQKIKIYNLEDSNTVGIKPNLSENEVGSSWCLDSFNNLVWNYYESHGIFIKFNNNLPYIPNSFEEEDQKILQNLKPTENSEEYKEEKKEEEKISPRIVKKLILSKLKIQLNGASITPRFIKNDLGKNFLDLTEQNLRKMKKLFDIYEEKKDEDNLFSLIYVVQSMFKKIVSYGYIILEKRQKENPEKYSAGILWFEKLFKIVNNNTNGEDNLNAIYLETFLLGLDFFLNEEDYYIFEEESDKIEHEEKKVEKKFERKSKFFLQVLKNQNKNFRSKLFNFLTEKDLVFSLYLVPFSIEESKLFGIIEQHYKTNNSITDSKPLTSYSREISKENELSSLENCKEIFKRIVSFSVEDTLQLNDSESSTNRFICLLMRNLTLTEIKSNKKKSLTNNEEENYEVSLPSKALSTLVSVVCEGIISIYQSEKWETILKNSKLLSVSLIGSVLPCFQRYYNDSYSLEISSLSKVVKVMNEVYSYHKDSTDVFTENQLKNMHSTVVTTYSSPLVIETQHPYQYSYCTTYRLSVPGALKLHLKFDPKCETSSRYDNLKVFNSTEEKTDMIYSRNNFPQELCIEGDTIKLEWTSDSYDGENKYGFKITVVGEIPALEDVPWISDCYFSLFSAVAKASLFETPISNEEKKIGNWLKSEFFSVHDDFNLKNSSPSPLYQELFSTAHMIEWIDLNSTYPISSHFSQAFKYMLLVLLKHTNTIDVAKKAHEHIKKNGAKNCTLQEKEFSNFKYVISFSDKIKLCIKLLMNKKVEEKNFQEDMDPIKFYQNLSNEIVNKCEFLLCFGPKIESNKNISLSQKLELESKNNLHFQNLVSSIHQKLIDFVSADILISDLSNMLEARNKRALSKKNSFDAFSLLLDNPLSAFIFLFHCFPPNRNLKSLKENKKEKIGWVKYYDGIENSNPTIFLKVQVSFFKALEYVIKLISSETNYFLKLQCIIACMNDYSIKDHEFLSKTKLVPVLLNISLSKSQQNTLEENLIVLFAWKAFCSISNSAFGPENSKSEGFDEFQYSILSVLLENLKNEEIYFREEIYLKEELEYELREEKKQ